MLITAGERYLLLRQALGFELRDAARNLRAFGRFADARGDTHVRVATVVDWAATASSPHARHIRLRDVVALARFLAAEDASHEIPSLMAQRDPRARRVPYIYTPEEIGRIVAAAGRIRAAYPLRRAVYATLLGLIASTGLRVSEALGLRFEDVLPDGVLHIRHAKFGKSRLVPLHPTTKDALLRYLTVRRKVAGSDDHVFVSAANRRISSCMVGYTFRRILKLAAITPNRARAPRIHDLRHAFATRALAQCSLERKAISRNFVALSTYLGHVDIKSTYWYLEATPELMTDIAAAGEALATGGRQ